MEEDTTGAGSQAGSASQGLTNRPSPAVPSGLSPERRLQILTAVLAGTVIAFFVVTYAYNSASFADSPPRGDQMYWVENILIPYSAGEMSLFEALTFEYGTLSHSHIPTLVTFLFSYEFLSLNLAIDRVIGVAALLALLGLFYRYGRRSLRADQAMIMTAVIASMLFVSSSPLNFRWSLLQFQMLYVLVAVLYLLSFVRWHGTHPFLHAIIAVPAALLLGDAIGTAAVAAGYAALALMAVLRRVPKRTLLIYYGLFPLQLLTLAVLFQGERVHTNSSFLDFADWVVTEPNEAITALYYGLAEVLVALRVGEAAGFLSSWDHAPLWFVVTIGLFSLAGYLLWRRPPRRQDLFPILLVLTGAIWMIGAIKARAVNGGPEVMQAPRFAVYIAVIGTGLVLLLASRHKQLGRALWPFCALAGLVVLVNAIGTVNVTDNERWVTNEQQTLDDLRAYATDRTQEYNDGSLCQRQGCLRGAWFLLDQQLVPLHEDVEPAPVWARDLRSAIYERLDSAEAEDRFGICIAAIESDERALLNVALNEPPWDLSGALITLPLRESKDDRAQAERIIIRVIRDACDQPTDQS